MLIFIGIFISIYQFFLPVDQTSDQFYRLINSVACTVDTQIIIDRITPALTGKGMIIILVLMIHLAHQINGLFQIQILSVIMVCQRKTHLSSGRVP